MNFDKVIFMETIPTGSFANYRMGVEGTLEPGESITEAFKQAKQRIIEAFKAINPGVNYESSESLGITVKDNIHIPYNPSQPIPAIDRNAIDDLEIAIDNATTLEDLAKHKEAAAKLGLVQHYMDRLKVLSK